MRHAPLLFALFGLTTVGCTEYGVNQDPETIDGLDDASVPDIEATPMELDFGSLQVGERATATEVVTLHNVGDGDLHIMDIQLSDADSPFDLSAVTSPLVRPGESVEFTVTFTPETALLSEALVLVESDDPDEPTTEIQLRGEGIAPIIDVSPSEYDFGQMYIGCDGEQALTIANIGNDTLVVDSFTFNTGSTDLVFDDDLTTNGELPWDVAPGEIVQVWVDYAPLDEYQDVGYLSVASNDPATPVAMATQKGQGKLFGENTDVYEQPINGATDILFAVDWSCSMWDDVANVESNFETFITTLAAMDADYHVAAVTDDDGCINGSYAAVDNSMTLTEQKDRFGTMLCESYSGTYCNSYGSNTERAFMLIEAALKSSNIGSGGCNEGFYREDATLALVGVSDEPEQSVNPYTYYVSQFQAMKSDSDDVVMHAIGGDYPSGCGSNQAYTGFYEATVATGGLFLSICATDFGSHLEALAEGSAADLTSFELTDIPVPETIEVTVNGVPSPTGWSYNAVDNTIDFEEDYVPEGGSTVQIYYALYGDCES